MAVDLLKIKAGDRVWIGWWSHERADGLRTVTEVTPTQIVIDWSGSGYLKRFKRESGYERGGGIQSKHISGVATKAECAAYDEQHAANRKESERRRAEEKLREERRDRLTAEFEPIGGYFGIEYQGEDAYGVTIHLPPGFGDDVICEIAELVKARAAIRKATGESEVEGG